jgi:hypothetical protein
MFEGFGGLTGVFARNSATPLYVFVRLCVALVFGFLVSWIYRRTARHSDTSSFTVTLTLICILIAMVTQVIGDNVARAFSLVGTLSIVRFRTVVRDTRDTAYVIFAVVMGMAVGGQNLWIAILGFVVVAIAAFLMAREQNGVMEAPAVSSFPLLLSVRVGLGHEVDQLLNPSLNAYLDDRKLMSVATAKQGAALQVSYEARLRPEASAVDLVSALNQTEGVQDVRINRRGFEAE